MLINVKMPTITIVGILTFMSRINSMLSCIEHEKSFIISGPDSQIDIFLLSVKMYLQFVQIFNK